MKIACHLYELHYRENYNTLGQAGSRCGALLRIIFDDGLVGYCDCHPWTELGDLPLQKQLSAFAENRRTPLLECSLYFARLDAEARHNQLSLFEGLAIPLSHQLVDLAADFKELMDQGITLFKLKAGTFPEKEISTMKSWVKGLGNNAGMRLRLDFNEKLSRQVFLEYWEKIPLEVRHSIDFVEDPYPYEPTEWSNDQKTLGVPFAADHHAAKVLLFPESARFHIHKPAVDKTPQITGRNTQFVVTSYLDHPLGQMCAAYTAGKLKALHPDRISYCGILTHKCYKEDLFVKSVCSVGPQLIPPQGTGFGFDTLLKEVQWQSL